MKIATLFIACFFTLIVSVHGQSFSSGSTGADGALDLASISCPNNLCEVQVPESGVFNYTTINVPAGRTLVFKRNFRNTPVTLLAQGTVIVSGAIDLSARDNIPGPGGFYGGGLGQNGFGPGGGTASSPPGRWVGPLSLFPIVGGSGGYPCGNSVLGPQGGGGGGAIVIASSVSISVSGAIVANGGETFNGHPCPGSGGAIRLVANSINITGALSAVSRTEMGVIRIEAPTGSVALTGNVVPPAGIFPINPSVTSNNYPVLTINSIGGYPVPSYAGSRFDTYDMLLPNQLTDPISVVVHGNNIPIGTQVTVGFVNGSPSGTSTPGTLSGTFESSTATATISSLNRTAVTYLVATAIFDPPAGAMRFNPKGPNQVAKIRIVASPGGKPKFVFLGNNGTELELAKVSKHFLSHLGL